MSTKTVGLVMNIALCATEEISSNVQAAKRDSLELIRERVVSMPAREDFMETI